jgi:hypothetical protein
MKDKAKEIKDKVQAIADNYAEFKKLLEGYGLEGCIVISKYASVNLNESMEETVRVLVNAMSHNKELTACLMDAIASMIIPMDAKPDFPINPTTNQNLN